MLLFSCTKSSVLAIKLYFFQVIACSHCLAYHVRAKAVHFGLEEMGHAYVPSRCCPMEIGSDMLVCPARVELDVLPTTHQTQYTENSFRPG